jgi:hypothetical protein
VIDVIVARFCLPIDPESGYSGINQTRTLRKPMTGQPHNHPVAQHASHDAARGSQARGVRPSEGFIMKHVRLPLLLGGVVVLWATTASLASAVPRLADTELFSKTALSCRNVDLRSWKHPTGRVLRDAGAQIESVQLCNNDHYPVYTVSFKYDPRTTTGSYFNPLYARMAAANGYWPFSFVDVVDNVIVNVAINKKHELDISYEDYTP